ncbi:hypothetical protein ALO86_200024 [Pseudomonas syringae pv. berberidis]|nr:hypothetical protein ALO86_200024 [Pseudomonas syringae pv. berberidis]RMQ31861.1 hypothetical protein ALQ06_200006 [Pseudomonas syringae pv. berberidis]
MGREDTVSIQSTQPAEQITGLGERSGRWRIQPVELIWRHAPAGQLKSQRREIGLLDFGGAEAGKLLMLGL